MRKAPVHVRGATVKWQVSKCPRGRRISRREERRPRKISGWKVFSFFLFFYYPTDRRTRYPWKRLGIGMAACLRRSFKLLFLLQRLAVENTSPVILVAVPSRSGHRCASSFSSSSASPSPPSSSSEKSPKLVKKLVDRLSAVIDAVNDRKLPSELRGQRNKVRSETDIINVVEQRIWHSMEEGQFENLPGKGKPLKLDTNPHADPAEDTLYRILSKNGCAPEWVELNKEIRSNISKWRAALKKARINKCSDNLKWVGSSEALKTQLRDINNKVFRYNLIVPFGRQMFGLNWEKELGRLEE